MTTCFIIRCAKIEIRKRRRLVRQVASDYDADEGLLGVGPEDIFTPLTQQLDSGADDEGEAPAAVAIADG